MKPTFGGTPDSKTNHSPDFPGFSNQPQLHKTSRFPVVCLECGKKFQTASLLPRCPKCHGSDIEPAAQAPLGGKS